MRRHAVLVVAIAVVAILVGARLQAQAPQLAAEDLVACTGVEDRQPVGVADSFSADVGTVWCFNKIIGAEEETSVVHVWYQGEQERARVTLPVRASRWRTWSRKQIPPQWAGQWRVVVEDSIGTVLAEVSFTVGVAAAAN